MKIFLTLLIIFFSGLFGYSFKFRLKKQQTVITFLIDFIGYYQTNIALFKNNLHEIIINYKLSTKIKNANIDNFFKKIDEIYKFNPNFILNQFVDGNSKSIIGTYLSEIGKCSIEIELDKTKNILTYLKEKNLEVQEKIKKEGDLYFKLSLAIGAVISILIW